MKPTAAPTAPRPTVNDVTARPQMAPAETLTPSIVGNIPVHNPGGDDADLEQIMQDVGKEMQKTEKKPKKGMHLFGRKHKKEAPFHAQPIDKVSADQKPPQAAHQPKPVQPTPQTTTPKPASSHPVKAQAKAKKEAVPKPVKERHLPVMAITMAILFTGAMIAAAVMTYKQP